jgi:hypothetical protein
MAADEVRHTSETGGQKGRKDEELMPLLRMAPAAFLTDLGGVYVMGAAKYSEANWRKGYPWSWSFNAMLRHAAAMIRGEWRDAESGKPHAAHVAWHCATLHEFERLGIGVDDRCFDVQIPEPTVDADDVLTMLEPLARVQPGDHATCGWCDADITYRHVTEADQDPGHRDITPLGSWGWADDTYLIPFWCGSNGGPHHD